MGRNREAGNGRARRVLIEGAWSYRHLPRTGRAKRYVHERIPAVVRDTAAKAQARLCARFRTLSGKGKKLAVTVTALARELAGFVWAVGREVQTA
jgi:transposase